MSIANVSMMIMSHSTYLILHLDKMGGQALQITIERPPEGVFEVKCIVGKDRSIKAV